MPLEATMIVVDNSESSRNGDYVPSRWEAQTDAANLIFHSKTQSNPESAVGLMSSAGSGPQVLTTLTTNPGQILDGLHRTKVGGASHLATGVQIASLALKHRQNKSQRQRIILFTCSPIPDSTSSLTKLAKKMKKNNTSIDIVAFGDLSEDTVAKLTAFNDAVKGGEGSTLLTIPPGPNLLSDAVVSSAILAGEGGMGQAAAAAAAREGGAAGGEFDEFGIDPSVDPELALALRMSLEEDRARQERERKATEEAEGKTALESVPEGQEGESKPLLDEEGKPAGESSGDAGASGISSATKKEEKKGDDDKMEE
ncbi:hypothetical protein B0A48_08954 [Cryoendolithus antarcticus]|uniref:VWFA domain-containing protein n=1 Tax=Cryoendolithus antarcticus TaxID=1507870 RepID=A0A1V8T4L8_9PEZI|nr:hypothetical protein B0A48_08954 [Cryoendolithus antarcticus]